MADPTVGEILRAARERAGLSLEDAARATLPHDCDAPYVAMRVGVLGRLERHDRYYYLGGDHINLVPIERFAALYALTDDEVTAVHAAARAKIARLSVTA